MKRLLLILPFLSGCTTNPATGARKILGLIPAGTVEMSDPSVEAMAFAQLAPLVWASIPLIVCGVFWWKLSGGSTGLGKMSVATGLLLIAISVVFPAIVGYLGIITIITILSAIGYAVYYYVASSKLNRSDL